MFWTDPRAQADWNNEEIDAEVERSSGKPLFLPSGQTRQQFSWTIVSSYQWMVSRKLLVQTILGTKTELVTRDIDKETKNGSMNEQSVNNKQQRIDNRQRKHRTKVVLTWNLIRIKKSRIRTKLVHRMLWRIILNGWRKKCQEVIERVKWGIYLLGMWLDTLVQWIWKKSGLKCIQSG